MTFPNDHRQKVYSANPLERLNGEINRRTEVAGIFPPPAVPPQSSFARQNLRPASLNEAAITRLAGAILLQQNDEWAVRRGRYMSLESVAALSDNPIVSLPIPAAPPGGSTSATPKPVTSARCAPNLRSS
ncbi:MAG: transposase [Methylocella sp.]